MQMIPLVEELLQLSQSNVHVEIEECFPGRQLAGGKYNMSTHTITLYVDDMKEQCIRLFETLERFPEYAAIILAHELGHAEDLELRVLAEQLDCAPSALERCKVALRIEENAWQFAVKLLPTADRQFMNNIIEHSLYSYHSALQADSQKG